MSPDPDHLAERIVDVLVDRGLVRPRAALVDAAEIARILDLERTDWVYANADRLGAIRLGDGPRARIRFDVDRVLQTLQAETAPPAAAAPAPRARRRSRQRHTTTDLIPFDQ